MDKLRKFDLKRSRYNVVAVPFHFSVLHRDEGYKLTYRFGLTRDLDFVSPVIMMDSGNFKYFDVSTDDPESKKFYLASELSYICEYRKIVDREGNVAKEIVNIFLPVDIVGRFVSCRDVSAVFDVESRSTLCRVLSPIADELASPLLRG